MSFIDVKHDGSAAPAEVSYEPLPDNTRVLATIVPTKKDSTSIEQRPFAKEGKNAAIPALNVRFRIADGQKGAGRNVFANVGLARQVWSDKKSTYVPNYTYFGLFRSLGYDVDAPEGLHISSDRELLGKEVELVLGVSDRPDSNGNYSNTVKFINKANGPVASQAATATPAAKSGSQPSGWAPTAAQPATAPSTAGDKPAWLSSPEEASALAQAAASSDGF